MKNLLTLLLLFCGMAFVSSCGSDVDCSDEAAIEAELSPLLETLFTAALNYATDQSDENCDAYKDVLSDIIDKSKEYQECVPSEERAEFDQDLDDLETQLAALPC